MKFIDYYIQINNDIIKQINIIYIILIICYIYIILYIITINNVM